jgi:hypothetical protein
MGKTSQGRTTLDSDPTDNGTNGNGVYTPREFARLVGRSVSTLNNWARKGLLTPHRYPSGQRFYTQDQVDQILNPDLSDPSESSLPSTTQE